MAHELSFTQNGTAEAFFALKPAWHGLGTVLDHVPNSREAITAAHLDWLVGKRPLVTDEGCDVPSHFATVRTDLTGPDSILGVVSGQYKIVQNRDAFGFLDSLVADGEMKYESAGALRGGKTVWILGRLPSVDEIAPGDNSLRYVLFSTSHDGTAAIHAIPTATRVVCANTLRVAVAKDVGIRHTGDVKDKLHYARQYLSQFDKAFADYRDTARTIAEKHYTPEEAKQYIAQLFPEVLEQGRGRTIRETKVEEVRRALRNERNQLPAIRGTWWSLFNAVTESVDHSSRGDQVSRNARETKMIRVLDGSGAEFKQQAFSLARSMAGAV